MVDPRLAWISTRQTRDTDGALVAHEAVMPDLYEPRWQHMLQEAADELQGVQSELARMVASALPEGEYDGVAMDPIIRELEMATRKT